MQHDSTHWLCTSKKAYLNHTEHMKVNMVIHKKGIAQVSNVLRGPCRVFESPKLRHHMTIPYDTSYFNDFGVRAVLSS
jgi:hypothetical protein